MSVIIVTLIEQIEVTRNLAMFCLSKLKDSDPYKEFELGKRDFIKFARPGDGESIYKDLFRQVRKTWGT